MAITINNQPNILHSAGNDNWYAFSSNISSFPEYKLIATVKSGSDILNTVTLPPNPAGISIFNIKNIIGDYIESDFNAFITNAIASTAHLTYNLDLNERFSGFLLQSTSQPGLFFSASVIGSAVTRGDYEVVYTGGSLSFNALVSDIRFLTGKIISPQVWTSPTFTGTSSTSTISRFNFSALSGSSFAINTNPNIPIGTFGYMNLANFTTYTTSATVSTAQRTAFKSSIDYLDYNEPNNYSDYVAGTQSSKFLTRAPRLLQIQPSEEATLTFINGTSSFVSSAYIVDNLGGTYSKSMTGLTNSKLIDIPTGTKNLNINPFATSYCVTLQSPISIATFSTVTFQATDVSGDWVINDSHVIGINTLGGNSYTFTIFGDPTTYTSPEDLYTFVILYSYNEVSNAALRANWNIAFVTGTGFSTFILTSKSPGSTHDIATFTITSSFQVIDFVTKTSGASIASEAQSSEKFCYEISCLNTRWTPFRLTWLNSLGGVDYYTFKFINNSSKRITRDNFDKNLNYGYNRQSRGITTYKLDDFDQFTVVSDPLSDEESDWLTDLLTSQEVNWIRGNELIPITIIADQYDRNIGLENSTLQLTFRLSRTNRK